MTKYTVIGLILFFATASMGQKTENKAFDQLLQLLLNHSISQIDVKQTDTLKNAVFLDTREKPEYEVSHIKQAIWVGFDDFDIKRISRLKKDQAIIVYCSVGYRSEKIGEKLKLEGYTRVYNLYGGIFEWVNQEREIVDNKSNSTIRVHAFDKTWGVWLEKGAKVY